MLLIILILISSIFSVLSAAKGNIYIGDQLFVTTDDSHTETINNRMEGSGNIVFGDTIAGPVGVVETFL